MTIVDALREESTERLRIAAEHSENTVGIIHSFYRDLIQLLCIVTLELEASKGKLSDALGTVRSLRRVAEENDKGDRWRRKELLAEVAKLREDIYHERDENKRLLLTMSSSNHMEHVVYALAQSYESELERLRTQIRMMRENYMAVQLSDAWLKSEVNEMDRSVPLPSRVGAAEFAADVVGGGALTVSGGATRPLAPFLRMRSSLDRSSRGDSRLPVNTSCSLQSEKVIRQEYVFLRVACRWTRFYCILSQAKSILFFDSADDFSQSRHIVSLDLIRRITPVSSLQQNFVVELEYYKEAGGNLVEIAFAGKNERSSWMVLLHSQQRHTGGEPCSQKRLICAKIRVENMSSKRVFSAEGPDAENAEELVRMRLLTELSILREEHDMLRAKLLEPGKQSHTHHHYHHHGTEPSGSKSYDDFREHLTHDDRQHNKHLLGQADRDAIEAFFNSSEDDFTIQFNAGHGKLLRGKLLHRLTLPSLKKVGQESAAQMTSYSVVEGPDRVDYKTKCCCQTTDGVYFQVPKDYFRLNANLSRRKLLVPEPFNVPLASSPFEKLVTLLEKATIVSAATAAATVETEKTGADDRQKPQWMKELNKRQQKFVDSCLGITTWDGHDVYFYEEQLPKENDVVWVKVIQVNDTSAVVQLLEYGNHEGIIPYTEITRIRIRAIGKVIKVGKNEAAQVIRIDKDKGYIDLSKKQVTLKEAKECEARFFKGNEVRSIVCHVADDCGIPATQAMEMIAYPLYRLQPGKHAWDWLHELNQSHNVEGILGPLNLPEKAKNVLLSTLEHAMRTEITTIHADIEMTCFQCDGVNALREVLLVGRSFKDGQEPHIPISVTIVGPPKYRLRAKTELKEEGILRMKEVIETMKIEMAKRGGILKVVSGPYALGDEEKIKEEKNDAPDYDDDDETD